MRRAPTRVLPRRLRRMRTSASMPPPVCRDVQAPAAAPTTALPFRDALRPTLMPPARQSDAPRYVIPRRTSSGALMPRVPMRDAPAAHGASCRAAMLRNMPERASHRLSAVQRAVKESVPAVADVASSSARDIFEAPSRRRCSPTAAARCRDAIRRTRRAQPRAAARSSPAAMQTRWRVAPW